jgi:radical SAM-linked protein
MAVAPAMSFVRPAADPAPPRVGRARSSCRRLADVDADSGTASERPTPIVAEPRQRWRLVFRRRPAAPALAHRELVDGWLERLAGCGLPLPQGEGTRPRSPLTFAAPLPLGMPVESDLADLVLAERLPIKAVRPSLIGTLPEGIELRDLHDVWLGAPPLAASLAGADYLVGLAGDVDSSVLEEAARSLLAASELPRQRPRGTSLVEYDLRPLLGDIEVADPGLRIRTLFDSARGAGRPEEVVAALGAVVGRVFEITTITRERVILADQLV